MTPAKDFRLSVNIRASETCLQCCIRCLHAVRANAFDSAFTITCSDPECRRASCSWLDDRLHRASIFFRCIYFPQALDL